ncbi:hypothetical protein [Streptomyces iconiensis]|uniref:Zinc-finger n=1 Tax=Streptomyces iconiensis TaxID=1384038 RepID=A0ABT6ZRG8_9ACTN|nr:hypothetical protein [Streptomyces iconiensis]MDJ1131660.1 hypothetical protein [Streptomyces iconiensis]
MTSTPSTSDASGQDEHPEVTEISALTEGILPVERQEAVRTHLSHCELCADVRTSLDEIRDTLGTLPGTVRMPEDIASRIDAALAAEALLDATVPPARDPDGDPDADADPTATATAPVSVSRETEREERQDHPERSGTPDHLESPEPETAAPAAAAESRPSSADAADAADDAAVPDPIDAGSADATPLDAGPLTAGAAPADADPLTADAAPVDAGSAGDPAPADVSRETRSSDRPPGHASGATGPGRASRTSGRRRARRWRTATLIAAASVAVLSIGGITIQSLSGNPQGVEASSDQASKDGSGKSAKSDAEGDRQLKQRVQSLLARQDSGAPSESGSNAEPGKPSDPPTVDTKRSPSGDTTLREDRAGGMGAAPSCVRDGIHRDESPLAVDAHASYEGHSGYLLVLPHEGGDPRRVDAYVVDPSCVSADPSGPGKVLLKRTYPRG